MGRDTYRHTTSSSSPGGLGPLSVVVLFVAAGLVSSPAAAQLEGSIEPIGEAPPPGFGLRVVADDEPPATESTASARLGSAEAPGWRRGTRRAALVGTSMLVVGVVSVFAGWPLLRDFDCEDDARADRGFRMMVAGGVLGGGGIFTTFFAWMTQRIGELVRPEREVSPVARRRRLLGVGYFLTIAGGLSLVVGTTLGSRFEGGANVGVLVGGSLFGAFLAVGLPVVVAGHLQRPTVASVSLRVGPGSLLLEGRF